MNNAYEHDKDYLYGFGVALATAFLKANKIELPEFSDVPIPTAGKPQGSYGCGVYLPRLKKILVTSSRCAKPAHGTIRQWSFPGYSVDRTPVGVVCHEAGHRLDHAMNYPSNTTEWRVATWGSKVSSYEPNMSEAFAESIRLFITNAALLRAIAPRRFSYLSQRLILSMRFANGPDDPLAQLRAWGAAPAILQAAANKAKLKQA